MQMNLCDILNASFDFILIDYSILITSAYNFTKLSFKIISSITEVNLIV